MFVWKTGLDNYIHVYTGLYFDFVLVLKIFWNVKGGQYFTEMIQVKEKNSNIRGDAKNWHLCYAAK